MMGISDEWLQLRGGRIDRPYTRRGLPARPDARKLPLSRGRLKLDDIECGYHGLTFDKSGSCTRIPGVKRVPPSVRVRSYPAVSRYGLVWVWMGDPARARLEDIFPVEHYDDPTWARNTGGSMIVDCNFLYITDNLLDPSHVAWVHQDSFGNDACEASRSR
jgi:phenylpropionate dioxygenase-like ring-hydroxylating dioxygenase large terminal subunit